MLGKIFVVEAIHRKNGGLNSKRLARIVVWATMENGDRVWIATVEGGLDSINVETKEKMIQEFFQGLSGRTIKYCERYGTFFAVRRSLPKACLLSYKQIKDAMQNFGGPKWAKISGQVKEKKVKVAARRKKSVMDAVAVSPQKTDTDLQKEDPEKRLREMQRSLKEELEEKRHNALHLWFVRRTNPKYWNEQWQADYEGKRYVLRSEDVYDPKEGLVPVDIVREFPGGIVIVRRI